MIKYILDVLVINNRLMLPRWVLMEVKHDRFKSKKDSDKQ